uniref:Putative ovule protein n=1 Tax=Solanum chacoense TaxID=4108 RepID=A0A0V0I350_SOLCH
METLESLLTRKLPLHWRLYILILIIELNLYSKHLPFLSLHSVNHIHEGLAAPHHLFPLTLSLNPSTTSHHCSNLK